MAYLMFDIHYHLLYGLDDGPKTIEGSVELAEASIAEGVTHIVCTPHANDTYTFDRELSRQRIEEINDIVGGRLSLGLGCDFHLSPKNIEDLYRDSSKYTINGKQYLLVEFPDYGISPTISGDFYLMIASGVVPIITHPERNRTLALSSGRLDEWVHQGCLVQITAGSLMGRFGKNAESMSHRLLKQDSVHFISSDAHSLGGRPPALAQAHRIVTDRYGQETADRLCIHNPRAAFFGENLLPQPAPKTPKDEGRRSKWNFFGLLRGR